jgi:hypothetical protein
MRSSHPVQTGTRRTVENFRAERAHQRDRIIDLLMPLHVEGHMMQPGS